MFSPYSEQHASGGRNVSGQGYHRAGGASRKRKKLPQGGSRGHRGSGFRKSVFSETADGADPVIRDILERGAGSDAAVRIADFGVIDITAGAFVLHDIHPPSICFVSGRSRPSADSIIQNLERNVKMKDPEFMRSKPYMSCEICILSSIIRMEEKVFCIYNDLAGFGR